MEIMLRHCALRWKGSCGSVYILGRTADAIALEVLFARHMVVRVAPIYQASFRLPHHLVIFSYREFARRYTDLRNLGSEFCSHTVWQHVNQAQQIVTDRLVVSRDFSLTTPCVGTSYSLCSCDC